MPIRTSAGVRLVIGSSPDPLPPFTACSFAALRSGRRGHYKVDTNVPLITAEQLKADELPVYLRQIGGFVLLVDASGNQLGSQESVKVSELNTEAVQTVTVTLAYQGFWHEGLAKGTPKASADEVKAALRSCSASRAAFCKQSLHEGVVKMEATTAQLREELSNTKAVAADESYELKATGVFGRFLPSEKQEDAMRIVIGLINARAITLEDDEYRPGEQRFRRQKIKHGNASAQSSDGQPATEPESVTAMHGEAMSFVLDPLESAIASTIGLMNDHAVFLNESKLDPVHRAGMKFLGEKLNSHLNHLLAAQLKRVTEHE